MKQTLLSIVIVGTIAATSLSAQTPTTPAAQEKVPPPIASPASNVARARNISLSCVNLTARYPSYDKTG